MTSTFQPLVALTPQQQAIVPIAALAAAGQIDRLNAALVQGLEAGLTISGTSPDKSLVEIVEIKDHPWFLGCQFHPEFTSRPMQPHPLFREFIAAAVANKKPEQEP